jgi:hypothetical protein
MPPVQHMGKVGWLIIREAMWDDKHPSVGMAGVEKVDRQRDEIIPIARHKNTVVGCGIPQLGFIIEAVTLYLVDTDDIESQTPADLRHRRVDILAQ